ncbi:hypothetical protein CDAR_534451 [Caerostris darwini]|uniref:Ribosomal protein L32 n=1 Tax=Caerostris darwini TaxID=1538125 RepID=A0AAV4QBJ1_9ARAC|nr:hypothetical protein CDAR_534451 [Caerostris darwini]
MCVVRDAPNRSVHKQGPCKQTVDISPFLKKRPRNFLSGKWRFSTPAIVARRQKASRKESSHICYVRLQRRWATSFGSLGEKHNNRVKVILGGFSVSCFYFA